MKTRKHNHCHGRSITTVIAFMLLIRIVESVFPSISPSQSASLAPSSTSSGAPSIKPTHSSYNPTNEPTFTPSEQPTKFLSSIPSESKTSSPSQSVSWGPTSNISDTPSTIPTISSSEQPTKPLSPDPPTSMTSNPSSYFSNEPSMLKTNNPRISKKTNGPSAQPSETSTSTPSKLNTLSPSLKPSNQPSLPKASTSPSLQPSPMPTFEYSDIPSKVPSFSPTQEMSQSQFPSVLPSESPSDSNTSHPSLLPSLKKSNAPSSIPSTIVSSIPSEVPTKALSLTQIPSVEESSRPSSSPTIQSLAPSIEPSSSTSSLPPPPPFWCVDSREPLRVIRPGSEDRDIICLWVEEDKEPRCKIDGVRPHCPLTCDFCQCVDNPGTFGNLKTCDWVRNKLERRCQLAFYSENCPASCGRCNYEFPSAAPTENFSGKPTGLRSTSPTLLQSTPPTQIHSVSPSSKPTKIMSLRPSNLRSQYPSLSPSLYPSSGFVVYSTDVVLGFESFSFPMDDKVKPTFEEITKNFLTKTKKDVEGLEIEILSVAVLSQYRIGGIKDGVRDNRRLQKTDDTGLVVDLSITGEVKPSSALLSENFAFADTVLNGFNNNFTAYKNLLQREPIIINSVTKFEGGAEDTNTEGNHLITIIYIGCSIAGGVLIAFLSIIFIKYRKDSTGPVLPRDLTFQDENEFIQSQGVRALPLNRSRRDSNNYDDGTRRSYNSQSTSSIRPVFHNSFRKSNSHESDRSSRWGNTNTNNDAAARTSTFQQSFAQWAGEPVEQKNFNVHNSGSYEVRNSAQHDYTNHMGQHILSTTMSDSDHEDSLGLNVSPDALLEAQRRSQQFSFVPQEQDSMVGLFPPVDAYNDDAVDRNERNNYSSAISSITSGDNYVTIEHICPSGPLGLIIDTSTKGPIVHSVKSSSSVKGFILPGDIIVGLDGKDTSSMTAPMITSYMASKAQQQQRRITMLRSK